MTTMTHHIATSDMWLEVASSVNHVSMQRRSVYDLLVHVGPDATNADTAHFLMQRGDNFWSLQPISSVTDKVFVRAANQDVDLVVMAG